MATETLNVPEDHLEDVITVIRAGLQACGKIDKETRRNLKRWCDAEEKYLKTLKEE